MRAIFDMGIFQHSVLEAVDMKRRTEQISLSKSSLLRDLRASLTSVKRSPVWMNSSPDGVTFELDPCT